MPLGLPEDIDLRPTPLDSNNTDDFECEEAVIESIRQRRDHGRRKYGTSMERTDLSRAQWLQHAQEEAMDLAIYLQRLKREESEWKKLAEFALTIISNASDWEADASNAKSVEWVEVAKRFMDDFHKTQALETIPPR